jgi:hypothetical protein
MRLPLPPVALLEETARDTRGAVFVEKLIVYLPLLLTFFVTWELAELAAAKLVVSRACSAAGRAAVVVLPDDPLYYDGEAEHVYEGRRREDIELAAGMILSAIPRLSSDFVVDVSDPPTGFGTIEVAITAPYECGAVSIMCGVDGALELTATSNHTYHGAKYAYGAAGGLGGGTSALVSTNKAGYRKGGQNGGPSNGGGNGGGPSNGEGSSSGGACPQDKFNVCTDDLSAGDKALVTPTDSTAWPIQTATSYGWGLSGKALDYRCDKGISPDKNVAVITYKCDEGGGTVVAASGKDEADSATDWDHSEPNVYKKYKKDTAGKTNCRILEYYTEREPCGGNDSCQTWFSSDGTWQTENPQNQPGDPDGPGTFTPNGPGKLTWNFEHNYNGLDPESCNYAKPGPDCPKAISDLGQACQRVGKNKKPKIPVGGTCETMQGKANKAQNVPAGLEKDIRDCLRYKNMIDYLKKQKGDQGGRSGKSRDAIREAMDKKCPGKSGDGKGKGKGK